MNEISNKVFINQAENKQLPDPYIKQILDQLSIYLDRNYPLPELIEKQKLIDNLKVMGAVLLLLAEILQRIQNEEPILPPHK